MKNLFRKVFVYALQRNAYNYKCETRDAQAIWRNNKSNSKWISRPVQIFRKNCSEYKESVN